MYSRSGTYVLYGSVVDKHAWIVQVVVDKHVPPIRIVRITHGQICTDHIHRTDRYDRSVQTIRMIRERFDSPYELKFFALYLPVDAVEEEFRDDIRGSSQGDHVFCR